MLGQNLSSILLTGWASLQSHATDWFLDKAVGWPKQPEVNKIDLHHHFVPDFFAQAIYEHGGDADGWPTPSWSPVSSRLIMKHLGVQSAILSAPDPGPCVIQDPDAQAALARRLNEHAALLRDEDPLTFGFAASLPDIRNASAAVAELRYALDFLRADAVTLFTSYGHGSDAAYLGHPVLDPVWTELNARNATVLVHPTRPPSLSASGEGPAAGIIGNGRLPSRLVDDPHEMTRTALDMVSARTLARFPNVKVVLSHAGGSLPWLMGRVTTTLRGQAGIAASYKLGANTTQEEAAQALRLFYYDVAASTAPHVLRTLLEVVPSDYIVYGSDFPSLSTLAQSSFLEGLESFSMTPEVRDMVNYRNAQRLLPRLAKQVGLPEIPDEEQCAVPQE